MKRILIHATIVVLVFSGCKKDNNGSTGNNGGNGNTSKQAYSVDLAGSYSSASGTGTATAIRVQKDGKILVLGYQWFVRLEKDGITVDNTFKPASEIASSTSIKSFELQDDGKIVVFGHFVLSNGRRAIIRLNADGSVDNSFNIPNINFNYFTRNAAGPGVESIKILGNGKMILAGQFEYGVLPTTYGLDMVRLNTDQSIDYTFSSPIGSGDVYGITNVLPLASGSFLLSGYGAITLKDGFNYNMVKINADGVLDKSFVYNSGGTGNTSVIVGDMKELADGKIVMGGALSITYANSVVRFNPTGSVDKAFKEYGFNESLKSLLVLPDNSMLLGFYPNTNLPTESRYLNYINASGAEDTVFHPGFTNAHVWCLASLDDQTVLAGGDFKGSNKTYSIIRLKKNQ